MGHNHWDPILGVFGARPILEPILVVGLGCSLGPDQRKVLVQVFDRRRRARRKAAIAAIAVLLGLRGLPTLLGCSLCLPTPSTS